MADSSKKAGGYARAAKLTPERRAKIARNAARARWSKVKGSDIGGKASTLPIEDDDVIMCTALEGKSEQTRARVARLLLHPLYSGTPVALLVTDARLPRRRRAEFIRLFLTPLRLFGAKGSKEVVASLETHGCEVFDPATVVPMSFIRMGLSARLSKAIAYELNDLFKKGGSHGTS